MAEQPKQFFAFTIQYHRKRNNLHSDAVIRYNDSSLKVKALWDTGATSSCISDQVVSSLGLITTGKTLIKTPAGPKEVSTYLIDIVLPNNVCVSDVRVCDSDIGLQGLDLLIGMDIIGLGDFSVSNYNGNTAFSFRIPSKQLTDYVLQLNIENKIGTHGKRKKKRK